MAERAQAGPLSGVKLRPLGAADLDAVVEIDAQITGRSRRVYFERRLQAALRAPALHTQFAAEEGGVLEATSSRASSRANSATSSRCCGWR